MNKVKTLKLSDFARVVMGQSPPSSEYTNDNNNIPFLQGSRTFTDKYPIIDTYCINPKKVANKNSILFSVRAPVGDINIASEDICIGRGLASIAMKNGNNNFLYYLLKYCKKIAITNANGTTFSSITKAQLEDIELPYIHDEKEQEKIAYLLSSLDDKIEINNKINAELEELGQALYAKWFINFDFPNEEGKPYKSSGGEMIESELGMIPKGWKVGKISNVCEFINGYAFKSSTYTENGEYRILTIKNVGDRKLEIKNNDSFINLIPSNINSEQVLKIGDLLLSLTGYTGRTCLNCEDKALLNQRVAKIKPINNVDTFVYNLFSSQLIKDEIGKLSHGSSQKNVSTKDISNINIAIPENFSIFEKFNSIANFKTQILSNMLENKKLEELRDFLIPQLISGNLEIKDVED